MGVGTAADLRLVVTSGVVAMCLAGGIATLFTSKLRVLSGIGLAGSAIGASLIFASLYMGWAISPSYVGSKSRSLGAIPALAGAAIVTALVVLACGAVTPDRQLDARRSDHDWASGWLEIAAAVTILVGALLTQRGDFFAWVRGGETGWLIVIPILVLGVAVGIATLRKARTSRPLGIAYLGFLLGLGYIPFFSLMADRPPADVGTPATFAFEVVGAAAYIAAIALGIHAYRGLRQMWSEGRVPKRGGPENRDPARWSHVRRDIEWVELRHEIPDYRGDPILVSTSDEELVVERLERRGFDVRVADPDERGEERSVLVALGKSLDFPDYYGVNWDAFDECFSDFVDSAKPPVAVVVRGLDSLLDADAQRFGRTIHFLLDTARGASVEHFQLEFIFPGSWDRRSIKALPSQ